MIRSKTTALHGGQFRWGAHHPHCDRHSHHLLWIKEHPLCLGCTSLYMGVAIGALLFVIFGPMRLSLSTWVVLHLLLLAPTALQPYFQKKNFKIVSRALLGLCSVSYFVSGWLVQSPIEKWLFLTLQLLAFAIGFFALSKWRERKMDNPCLNCPKGHFPVCEWNLPILLEHPAQNQIFGSFDTTRLAMTDCQVVVKSK